MPSKIFYELWSENEKWLYKSIYASLRNHADTEDILHDVLIKAIVGFGKLRDYRKMKPWLAKIAACTIADHFRRNSREVIWAIESFDQIAADYEEKSVDGIVIDDFLSALPDEWRAIVMMNLYYDISARRIAEITGGSYQAIRRRLTRTYRLLAKSLSCHEVGKHE